MDPCQVDAAIVRIMKTRKVLSHTLLITELFQQVTRFVWWLISILEERPPSVCLCVFHFFYGNGSHCGHGTPWEEKVLLIKWVKHPSLFGSCFLFSKTMRTRKIGRIRLVISFIFLFFFVKTLNSENKKSFQRTP